MRRSPRWPSFLIKDRPNTFKIVITRYQSLKNLLLEVFLCLKLFSLYYERIFLKSIWLSTVYKNRTNHLMLVQFLDF